MFCVYSSRLQSLIVTFMRGSRGWIGGPDPPPLKNHKNIGFLSNTGPDPLKNHKAIKPAFNVGPSSARQRNAIKTTFIMVFGSSHQLKKEKKKKVLSKLDLL